MDTQEKGLISLPAPVMMSLLSPWGNAFENLSEDSKKQEDLYLIAEYLLFSLILQQIVAISDEQCRELLKETPFFQKVYGKVITAADRRDVNVAPFQAALETTRRLLTQIGVLSLPFTFLGSFFERYGIFGEQTPNGSTHNTTGSFFTPAIIAQFIVNKTLDLRTFNQSVDTITCLDPASGGGIFLVALATALLKQQLFQSKTPGTLKLDCIRNILTRQIWGIDISKNAQRVTQLQLILWACDLLPHVTLQEVCSWVTHCMQGDFLSNNPILPNNFTIIVGNPPFGNLLSGNQKKDAKKWAKTRTREISELFLERALEKLDSEGCLGFIMPKTMAYYAQWARARGLLLPTKLAGVADLGLSFMGVNFETFVLFAQNGISSRKEENLPIFDVNLDKIGVFPHKYVRKTGLIPLQPLVPDDEALLDTIQKSSVPIGNLVQSSQITRGIYLSEEIKDECKPGGLLWINRVPDIQHYAIERLWTVDGDIISGVNPTRARLLQCPKVLLKVLRGRKVSVIVDPWGILVPTEKIVSILLEKCLPREILAWGACLNSWPASFYLQKLVFSGTTESARVLDFPYLKQVPVLRFSLPLVDLLSGIHLTLLLAAQIRINLPHLITLQEIRDLGLEFQQILFLSFKGETLNNPLISMESEFESNLELLRRMYVAGAESPPIGGLSRVNLEMHHLNQVQSDTFDVEISSLARDFVHQVKVLLDPSISREVKNYAEKDPQWSNLMRYFKARF
ncbi:MAG: Eco57I restriction endonuclease [Promethearchaeota archaeon CR_4]|nr:MAG: Eco57I restriction endonuclease [Candidatus Lokiarchaeota archaeon CR_4]